MKARARARGRCVVSLGFGLGIEAEGNLQAREAGLVRDEASGCAGREQRVGKVQQAVARARAEEVRGLLGILLGLRLGLRLY